MPRPTVEPELFASLRPPTYDAGFGRQVKDLQKLAQDADGVTREGLGERAATEYSPRAGLGRAAGKPAEATKRLEEGEALRHSVRPNGRGGEFSREVARDLAQRLELGAAVGSAATGGQLGDFFQYVVDHPVSLARQKSALLPVVGKDVEAARVSIYNPAVQPKHPLLGLRFKNTTGLHLAQGPVTVFEGSTYAGDTRVLDVQPGEERLVSYAIDLGTEVITQSGPGTSRVTSVKAVKGVVTTVTKVREERRYKVANRSGQDRALLVEHPNRTNQQFKLVETDKPAEETAAFWRFQFGVKAGGERTFAVREERDVAASVALSNSPDDQVRYFVSLSEATPALRQRLSEALRLKGAWDGQRRELAQVQADLTRLGADQDRIRKNLRETPKEAEVYQTYLRKLSDQEKEIDALTTRQKKLMDGEFAAKKAYDDYLAALTTE